MHSMRQLTGSLGPGNYMDQKGYHGPVVFVALFVFVCLFICCCFFCLIFLLCRQPNNTYFYSSAVVMFVVEPDEVNIFDQRMLEHRVKER